MRARSWCAIRKSVRAISTSPIATAISFSATWPRPSSWNLPPRPRGGNGWEIVSTRLKTKFSNNIRNNFGFLNRAAPEGIGTTDKLFVQEGRKVFKEVVPMVAELITSHLADNAIAPDQIKRLWLHQANINMNDLIARRVLGRDPEAGEAPCILDEYANTSSAGSMIAFHKYSADLSPGDVGHLCSFGAGYSAGSVILRKLH